MTIQGHSARITPLDAEGRPVGPAQDIGAAMLTLALAINGREYRRRVRRR